MSWPLFSYSRLLFDAGRNYLRFFSKHDLSFLTIEGTFAKIKAVKWSMISENHVFGYAWQDPTTKQIHDVYQR